MTRLQRSPEKLGWILSIAWKETALSWWLLLIVMVIMVTVMVMVMVMGWSDTFTFTFTFTFILHLQIYGAYSSIERHFYRPFYGVTILRLFWNIIDIIMIASTAMMTMTKGLAPCRARWAFLEASADSSDRIGKMDLQVLVGKVVTMLMFLDIARCWSEIDDGFSAIHGSETRRLPRLRDSWHP